MSQGGRNGGGGGVRVLDGGEVHVQRVEKMDEVTILNGVLMPTPPPVAPGKSGGLAAPAMLINVDEIAADFIRRKKETFLKGNKEKLNSMNLLLYMAPIAVILLLPATIFMEDNVVGNLAFALLNNVMHF
ncbi:hypothetical protein GUJ93_ZPchr0005g15423 [Zizania palustris]|uniref:Uncharacterized protein n=1 Tax=Zizania palustris TaxID=103762 RepID=A0A8J5T4W3_ZIZPA|nr:hypothetical protein GUJ93_ZPchr0005g15423 [Zizania palustris]